MPTQKYPINLATIGSLYGCSESVAKRMSAANVDLQNPFEVRQFLQEHARERTREGAENSAVFSAVKAVEKPKYYLDVFASLYGVRKERMEAIVEEGVDLRNRKAVRAALATQGTPAAQSPSTASQKPTPTPAPSPTPLTATPRKSTQKGFEQIREARIARQNETFREKRHNR